MSGLAEVGDVTFVQPTANHTHTVILLHGRGSNAEEFRRDFLEAPDANGISLPERLPFIRWVLPSAPERYSTVFQEHITEWFDVYSLTRPQEQQELQLPGLRDSIRMIQSIAAQESERIPTSHIVLGGISQGCAVASLAYLLTGLTWAGLFGIAGWLPLLSRVEDVARAQDTEARRSALADIQSLLSVKLPAQIRGISVLDDSMGLDSRPRVFLSHGVDDDIVDVSLGIQMRDTLRSLGLEAAWAEYDVCGHWIKEPDGIDALAEFLAQLSRS